MNAAATAALVLASASPRRRRLLGALGLVFAVRPVAIDERPRDGELPELYVRRLAREKAAAAARGAAEVVLGADTAVVIDGELLGKPADRREARLMLTRLAGRRHRVLTGVALMRGEELTDAVEETAVEIASLEPAEIDWYVGTGEPLDKAGAYAIQGLGALLVERVEGNYSNVVGLPLPAVRRLCRQLGIDLLSFRPASART